MMIRFSRLAYVVVLAVCSSTSHALAEEWTSMFNGETLEGWTLKNGTATYNVEDGAIVGRTTPGSPNAFMCSVTEYGDFELEFETKVDTGLNSGVQIRSQTDDKPGENTIYKTGRVNGPQVEIAAKDDTGSESGYIYGEATGRGWLVPDDQRISHTHFNAGEWNHYRIVAKGPRIQTFINGEPIADLTDEAIYKTHPRGFIGLQVHSIRKNEGPFEVRWRNLRIREL